MKIQIENIRENWRRFKSSSSFHNICLYLSFVAVATLFWIILAMNDNVTETFDVKMRVVNVPDTVMFINDPPPVVHVTLRDKGTNLMRTGIVNRPHIDMNFRDFADKGVFRFTRQDLNTALKSTFGTSAQIASTSIDSLNLRYTTEKGKRVPIVVRADVTASSGYVLSGNPVPLQRAVMVYSTSEVLDTITRAYTEVLSRRDLSQTSEFSVKLCPVPGAKLIPDVVKVKVPVETLVKKEGMATVHAENVPAGESLLLFPNKVKVSYFVPMSLFNIDLIPIDVKVDYNDTKVVKGDRIPVSISTYSDYVVNPVLMADSVEYTLVRE